MQRQGKAWVTVALAAWAAVGLLAEAQGRIGPVQIVAEYAPPPLDGQLVQPAAPPASTTSTPSSAPSTAPNAAVPAPPPAPAEAPAASAEPPAGKAEPPTAKVEPPPGKVEPKVPPTSPKPAPAAPADPNTAEKPSTAGPPSEPLLPEPTSWQGVTPAHIEEVMFGRLPSDSGVVAPIARGDEPLDPEAEAELEEVRTRLAAWAPARVPDPVQRVRNVLYVAAVPDVFQMPEERYLPLIAFERLQADVPKHDLIKILFWVATHPAGGDDSAVDDLRSAGLKVNGPGDMEQTRERVMIYALKLLGRLVGKIPQ